MEKIVGIGEYVISNNRDDVIKTFALASCVAVTAYSPINKTAGMIHIVLPYQTATSCENYKCPSYYATLGVPLLINKMCLQYGCFKKELIIELFGGAKSSNKNDIFHIGQRNIIAVKNVLNDLRLNYIDTETGGIRSRTLELDVKTGKKMIYSQPLIL